MLLDLLVALTGSVQKPACRLRCCHVANQITTFRQVSKKNDSARESNDFLTKFAASSLECIGLKPWVRRLRAFSPTTADAWIFSCSQRVTRCRLANKSDQ